MPPLSNPPARVIALLRPHPAVVSVGLTGSRATGAASDLSDWDFAVEASDFARLAADLPSIVAPLSPILQQWDRLGHVRTYMLMLPDATKVDLTFPSVPQQEAPPWQVTAQTLQSVDDHFWDWITWLASKDRGGKSDLVASELRKLSTHILRPLGVDTAPPTITAAIDTYVPARDRTSGQLGVTISPVAQGAVLIRLQRAAFSLVGNPSPELRRRR